MSDQSRAAEFHESKAEREKVKKKILRVFDERLVFEYDLAPHAKYGMANANEVHTIMLKEGMLKDRIGKRKKKAQSASNIRARMREMRLEGKLILVTESTDQDTHKTAKVYRRPLPGEKVVPPLPIKKSPLQRDYHKAMVRISELELELQKRDDLIAHRPWVNVPDAVRRVLSEKIKALDQVVRESAKWQLKYEMADRIARELGYTGK